MKSATALLQKLKQLGCIRYSDTPFQLKSGITSNLYVDMRLLITNPCLLRETATMMQARLPPSDTYDYVAGVVAGGVPLAVMLSQVTGKPMLMIRSERKAHGTGNLIEGLTAENRNRQLRVLLVEDVVSTGGSILDVCAKIKTENANIVVVGAIAVLLRGPLIDSFNLPLFHVWTLDDMKRPSLEQRRAASTNAVAKTLFQNMISKQSNLIWSADIGSGKMLLEVLEIVAPHIIGVKFHFDTLNEGDTFDFAKLKSICKQHNLVIINDRKYADIESTVLKQVRQLQDRVTFDCATVHSVAGSGPINALASTNAASIIVAEMSCDDSIPLGARLALDHPLNVAGVVCQSRAYNDVGDGFVYMTPGVHLSIANDGLNQNYRSVEDAINRDGCDVVIVGRGIINPTVTTLDYGDAVRIMAEKYKQAGWKALTNELNI